ncbi:Cullin-4A, partial [Nowakowskiella sp. JEL0078]
FTYLMKENAIQDITRLYRLFSNVDRTNEIRIAFTEFMKQHGKSLVQDPSRDSFMVDDLLHFKSQIDQILKESFLSNDQFAHSVKESFEYFINTRVNMPAELIAKHIDTKLKTVKGVSEAEVEIVLDKCLALFRFIQGKDVFEAFYKKDLAKRLLLNKSASIDSEKSMLNKLQIGQFTSKFSKFIGNVTPKIDLYVNVLTAGQWPSYPTSTVILPSNGLKELSVSLAQTVVLLLFNNNQSLSFKEIRERTNLDAKELTRTLQSLFNGKARVLIKDSKSKEVLATDMLQYNNDFENPSVKIKINSIQVKETPEERKSTNDGVFLERQFVIDAAVVRIMKMRKTMNLTDLVSELFTQLKFPVKALDLKERVETLLDREYLERDPNNLETFRYLA